MAVPSDINAEIMNNIILNDSTSFSICINLHFLAMEVCLLDLKKLVLIAV